MSARPVAQAEDLREGEPLVVEVGNREIGLFRVDGSVYAIPNRCPHQQAPLCEGTVDGAVVVDEAFERHFDYEDEVLYCPWHQLPIRLPTGECLSFSEWSMPSYEVTVEDGTIYVDPTTARGP